MAKTKLTLIVDAEWLINNPDATEATVLEYCSMVDDEGHRADHSAIKTSEEFKAGRSQDVRWEGKAVENGEHLKPTPIENWKYSVGIDFILYLKKDLEKNIFESLVLEGKGGKNSKVTAKVKQTGINIEDKCTYLIVFSVYGDNGAKATFFIDPKIIVNT